MPLVSQLITILLLCVVPYVLSSDHGITTDEEICELLENPGAFIPGFQTYGVLKRLGTSRPRLLMMDVTDSFNDDNSPKEFARLIVAYLKENIAKLDDVKIASFVFQLDCIMDFLLLKKRKEDLIVVVDIRADRKEIIANIQSVLPHRRLLLDLLTNIPSLRVEKFMNNYDSSKGSGSPLACLQYVEYLDSLVSVDPFEVLNLRDSLLSLLSSRLEDPSMEEHDKQVWITQFADSFFWMSSTRVAICITAMLRAKRFDELYLLQYIISFRQWKLVSNFMSPDELTTVPEPLQLLITGQKSEPFRLFLDDMSNAFLVEFKARLSSILELFDDWKSATNAGLQQKLSGFNSMRESYSSAEQMLDFSIFCALLIVCPDIKSGFRKRFAPLLKLGKSVGPVKELYSSSLMDPDSANIFSLGVLNVKTKVQCMGPGEAPFSLVFSLMRNFRQIISGYIDVTYRSQLNSLVTPEVLVILTNPSEADMFLELCDYICKYDLSKDNLNGDLEGIQFKMILRSTHLFLLMKAILLEGVIGMYLCQNHHTGQLCNMKIGFDESFSNTVGKLRGVQEKSALPTFVKFLNDTRDCYSDQPELFSAAYAMFMWAILPRIMDDDSGADEVIKTLQMDLNLQTNKQFQLIRSTAFRLMLEYTSIDHLIKVIPKLASCGIQVDTVAVDCTLSASRRKMLFSSMFYSEASTRHNLSLLLLVKQQVPEKSIDYMDRYYAGSAPLNPISMAHAIAEAVTIIGQGKKENIQLLPQPFLLSIFMGKAYSVHREFFDRLGYELESCLHLSLLPHQVKSKLIDMLSSSSKVLERSRRLMMDLVQISLCEISKESKKIIGEPKLQKTVEKKPESKLNFVVNAEPKNSPRSRPRQNQLSLLAKKYEKTIVSQVADPVRPSRSRPTRTGQSAKDGPGTNDGQEQKQKAQQIKPQKATILQEKRPKQQDDLDSTRQKKKEKALPDRPEPQLKEVAAQEEIANGQQREIVLVNASQPSEEKQVEPKNYPKSFCLTIKLLQENATIQSNGHVLPKDQISKEFKEYIEEKVSYGTLPFKLDTNFWSYLTKETYKERFKSWKQITNWKKERVVWRPKLYIPIRIYVGGVAMDKIADLRDFVMRLTKEQVARLQSLCYFGNHSITDTDKVPKRSSSKRTLKFEISTKVQIYETNRGWIQMHRFPESFDEFSKAVEALTDSPATDNSVGLVIANFARTAKRAANVCTVKKATKAEQALPDDQKEVELEKHNDKFEIKEQETITALGRGEENAPHAKSPLDNFNKNDFSQLGNSSNLQSPSVPLDKILLKVASPVFVPKNSDESESISEILKNFLQKRHFVFRYNYSQKLTEFGKLLQSGEIEYIALDCEMTGMYTTWDEAEHRRDRSLISKDNTAKLIKAVDHNLMFQLGLTVKTRDGKYSVWSLYTAPTLTAQSFTPDTFNFFYPTKQVPPLVAMSKINSIAMNSVSVNHILHAIFIHKIPLVLFSGYVDLMHARKAANLSYQKAHEYFEKEMECDFYDVKQIALNVLHKTQSLELLLQELYDNGLTITKEHLHDASFDSLLTALAFDRLRELHGAERMTKRLLFNYEKEYKDKLM